MQTVIRRMTHMGSTGAYTQLSSIWSSSLSWIELNTPHAYHYSTVQSGDSPRALRVSAFSIPKTRSVEDDKRMVKAMKLADTELKNPHFKAKKDLTRDMHFEKLHLNSDSLDAGEDAFFVSPLDKDVAQKTVYETESRVVGVFDGVGGWARLGIDPREVSRAMMHAASSLTGDYEQGVVGKFNEDPVKLLRATYDAAIASGEARVGSTTACLVLLDSQGKLQSANLGDSGFVVLRRKSQDKIDELMQQTRETNMTAIKKLKKKRPRDENMKLSVPVVYEVAYRSSEQQHYFNAPYQLAIVPEEQRGDSLQDKPEDADRYHDLQVQPGDVIVVATDGVFDNLFDNHIAAIVSLEERKTFFQPERFLFSAAREICVASFTIGHMKNVDTPFVRRMPPNIKFKDGKADDCTVIVAKVIGTEDDSTSFKKE